jgi:hypothetical protein
VLLSTAFFFFQFIRPRTLPVVVIASRYRSRSDGLRRYCGSGGTTATTRGRKAWGIFRFLSGDSSVLTHDGGLLRRFAVWLCRSGGLSCFPVCYCPYTRQHGRAATSERSRVTDRCRHAVLRSGYRRCACGARMPRSAVQQWMLDGGVGQPVKGGTADCYVIALSVANG